MPDEEVTIGEVWRRLEGLERRIDSGFSRLDRSIDALQFVHQDVYASNQRAIWDAINETKGKITWVTRTVAGALIVAVITALLGLFAARGGV